MSEVFKFLAGPARVLIFNGQNLIGVGKSATETTFTSSITAEDIRAGQGNVLRGRYFHDADLAVNITYADFSLDYMALTSGGAIVSGGTVVGEEQLSAAAGGALTLTHTAVAIDGALIGWYRKVGDTDWTVANVVGNKITVAGASAGDAYCVKYFYVDQNAKSMILRADYVPSVVHLVLIADEFAGVSADDLGGANRYGKLIIDIPAYQLAGGQELSLTSGSASTISLNGNALAVSRDDSCEDDLMFGTITEQIFGARWQDEVLAIAPEDSTLANGDTIAMRVIFKGLMAAQRKSNDNFTFTGTGGATVTATGVVSGTAGQIRITLKNAPNVSPAIAVIGN